MYHWYSLITDYAKVNIIIDCHEGHTQLSAILSLLVRFDRSSNHTCLYDITDYRIDRNLSTLAMILNHNTLSQNVIASHDLSLIHSWRMLIWRDDVFQRQCTHSNQNANGRKSPGLPIEVHGRIAPYGSCSCNFRDDPRVSSCQLLHPVAQVKGWIAGLWTLSLAFTLLFTVIYASWQE